MFADIREELRGAELGDRRRSARLERIGERLAMDPSRSFPEAMASEGALEAFYRFLNSEDVRFGGILRPHALKTAQRCCEHDGVLVLHDTTSMEFTGVRHDLGRLQTGSKHGFFLHTGLAVTTARDPLGILAAEPWVRERAVRGRNKRQLRKDPKRESLRWARGVAAAEEILGHPRLANAGEQAGSRPTLCAIVSAPGDEGLWRARGALGVEGRGPKHQPRDALDPQARAHDETMPA